MTTATVPVVQSSDAMGELPPFSGGYKVHVYGYQKPGHYGTKYWTYRASCGCGWNFQCSLTLHRTARQAVTLLCSMGHEHMRWVHA